jgi:hypothetical protein
MLDDEQANRRRLLMLSRGPCPGKTTVTPGRRAAPPAVVIFDLHDFLDAGSRLAGIDLRQQATADRWPAQNDLCVTFASAVLAAGLDVLLLSPLSPPARLAVGTRQEERRQSEAEPRTFSPSLIKGSGVRADASLRGKEGALRTARILGLRLRDQRQSRMLCQAVQSRLSQCMVTRCSRQEPTDRAPRRRIV